MVPTLFATRGLPGCGKSTWARAFVQAERAQGIEITMLSRDDFRDALGVHRHGDTGGEQRVQAALAATARELLEAGHSVVTDDCNLRLGYLQAYAVLAIQTGVAFMVVDFTDVPLAECLRRNAQRPPRRPGVCSGAAVPDQAINDLHAAYLRGRDLPLPVPDTATLLLAPAYGPAMTGSQE